MTSGSWRKRGAQGAAEAGRVGADLALVDDAPLVAVHELDRVLDRDDVVAAGAVDLVDQRRERRRLARAGRAGDEDEPARQLGEEPEPGRQAEVVERLQLVRDDAERSGERVALHVHVHAEAGQAGHAV